MLLIISFEFCVYKKSLKILYMYFIYNLVCDFKIFMNYLKIYLWFN